MSDKAKEYLENYDPQIKEVGYDNYFYSPKQVIERMQSYAEQHLEDVLVEEIENLEHQLKVEGFETSFELQIASDRRRCLKVTLNLLKQRKG